MADLDEFAGEVAAGLMLDAARSVTERQVKNTVGGHENLAGLTGAGHEQLVSRVLDLIRTADITIDTNGG